MYASSEFTEVKVYLLKKLSQFLDFYQMKSFLKLCELKFVKVQPDAELSNAFMYVANPLKLVIMCAEVLYKMKMRFPFFEENIEELRENF